MENIEYWYSEYELRLFIDTAQNITIEGVYLARAENRLYSVFTDYIYKNDTYPAKENFDKFCTQLNQKLTQTENWKAIEIDLKHRFLPMLNQYIDWYNLNKAETLKFEPYNPYELMMRIIESTKREILKYFPETLTPPQVAPPPQGKTTKQKIETILEPLRKAFEDTGHIDKIIEGFVYYLTENKYPISNKAVVRKKLVEFLIPFREIQDKKILKQKEISKLLQYFIEGTKDEPEYSEAYIKRLLSQSKPKE